MTRGSSYTKHEVPRCNRSILDMCIHSRVPEAKPIAPLVEMIFFHLSSSNTYPYTRTHTKAPRHEETSLKRDCCCMRGWPRCEVARWRGDYARCARWPGDQATCQLLYAAENMPKPAAVHFFSCGFAIVLRGAGSAESDPVITRQMGRN